jgi:polar amino acid transport system permease protein
MNYVFQWGEALKHLPYLLGGAWITLHLSFLIFWTAAAIGVFGALGKIYGGPALRTAINAYVVFFTNTPGLVKVFFVFFALPEIGIILPPYHCVLLAVAINAGAYMIEIMRGGFVSVRQAELDASEALGFSRLQTLYHVIVPHIAKVLYAPLSNYYIIIILGTALASIFGVEELAARAYNVAANNFRAIEVYTLTAGIYIALTILASALLAVVGRFVFRVEARIF